MKTIEQEGKNFVIMILFLVFAVSGAKTLHDVTASDVDQTAVEMTTEKEVVSKE